MNINYINPPNIKFLKNIVKDSYIDHLLDNSFCVFKSINDIIYLIYANKNKSIIAMDVINNQKINEIKNPHYNTITNFRHFFDEINNRDLILSISEKKSQIKVWNIYNFECLLTIQKIYEEGRLLSACILNNNNNYYIITSKCNFSFESELIKVFNFNGKKIKSLPSKDETIFIDTYKDIGLSINYIITCNKGHVKSYNFNNNKLYQKYYEKNNNSLHYSAVMSYNEKNFIKLIESCADGIIRIWNFHSGEFLDKIKISKKNIYGICLWNSSFLLIGCEDNSIKILNIEEGVIINTISGHNDKVLAIKKINDIKYGELLFSQGYLKEGIKLWINDN